MIFINRREEFNSFKNNYEIQMRKAINQIYIVEANHGVGKSEFIREVSKFFIHHSLNIYQPENNGELSIFKRFVLELDKASIEDKYDDFKTFYNKKINNTKAFQLLLKVTEIFGQTFIKSKKYDMDFSSLIEVPKQNQNFILTAQVENLFEYVQYVSTKVNIHVIFHNTSIIDLGSLDLLSKLIAISKGNVFIFETNCSQISSKIEQSLKNNHNIFLKKYTLNKLSNEHIELYIRQLLFDLKLHADNIDSCILKKSIEKGDLEEISSILNDFNDRLQNDTSAQIRSTKDIIQGLSTEQKVLLITIVFANGKLDIYDIRDVVNELNNSFDMSDVEYLMDKKLIEKREDYLLYQSFVNDIINKKEFLSTLKYATASALIKYANIKLLKQYDSKYVDILSEYYVNNKQFCQLKTLSQYINNRLRSYNTQAERVDYFKKFVANRIELYKTDKEFAIIFAKIAYNSNLYSEAKAFIDLVDDSHEDIIFLKALILNRCEKFEESRDYIILNLKELNKQSSHYFNLSLVLMMNLIQLNKRNDAFDIFNELVSFTNEPLYPYLKRLSNVFYDDFEDKLTVVESISKDIYQTNTDEFSGLHAVYLSYLYSLTKQTARAEECLQNARNFFGSNLIYNHMVLHNEATIKFHSQKINEDIPALLYNAKITAYDEYDQFAINNNLLVYYILSDRISNLECQKIALELEVMIEHTNFKRFIDKIYYNLYHYYLRMFNFKKRDFYKKKLILANIAFDDNYNYKLMYETSWKLPIDI